MTVATSEPATETATRHRVGPPRFDGIVLEPVSWEVYELLLRDIGDQNIRITYDRGRMVLMSPRSDHESWKGMLGRMIESLTEELNIPLRSLGSTTWRRQDVARGLEPDECYYVQHEPQVRGRMDLDLQRDPPPDLVVEINITHNPADRQGIYAALGVSELWQFDGRNVTALGLSPAGQYHAIEFSHALPFLRPRDLDRFLAMLTTSDETSVIRAFRAWVRETFAGSPGTGGTTPRV